MNLSRSRFLILIVLLACAPAGLRAAVERLTKESTDHAYIQTVCEDTLVQLMDSNERLRREKQAWQAAELQG